MVNFQPLFDRVLISRNEVKSDSTIITPDAYTDPSKEGTVVAIGQYVVLGNQVMSLLGFVQVGDVVLFGEYSIENVEVDGQKYVLARVQDLRGKRLANSEQDGTTSLSS